MNKLQNENKKNPTRVCGIKPPMPPKASFPGRILVGLFILYQERSNDVRNK